MKKTLLALIVMIALSAACADYLIYEPGDRTFLPLYDSPYSSTVNARIEYGGAVKVLDRAEEAVLLMDTRGVCGWARITDRELNSRFRQVSGEGSAEFFPEAPAQRDSKLDSLNSTHPPEQEELQITVSLKGLTVHVVCEAAGFDRVYPVGVGVKGSSGKSITPTCSAKGVSAFRTHYDTGNSWFYMKRRWSPSYFGGFPFLRTSIKNSKGAYTYGMHGPITQRKNGEWYLQRGYVSHGCMRMRSEDVKEFYPLAVRYPRASIHIQQDYEYDAQGNKIDCDYPLWQGE